MSPVLVDFGFLTLHGYGTMIALGVLLSSVLAIVAARRAGLARFEAAFPWLFLVMAAAAFCGGKGLWWLMSSSAERGATTSGAGFVYYGAILLVVPATMLALRAFRIPVLPAVDLLGMFLPLTHAFGRLGCFLAGCCHGCRSDGPLAVTFSDGIGLNHVPLHPVQLYEAAANFAVFALLWWLRTRALRPGTLFGITLILTGLSRVITEFFRGDVPAALWGNARAVPGEAISGVTQAQAIGAGLALGSALWLISRKRGR